MTNLTLGIGSQIASTKAVAIDGSIPAPVDITVTGNLVGGNGVANIGDEGDDESTNLTLADGSTFDWTFGPGPDNYVHVINGDVVFETGAQGITIQLQDGGGEATGQNVAILRSYNEEFTNWDTANITILAPAGMEGIWTWDGLAILGDLTGGAGFEDYEYLVLENLSTGGGVLTEGDSDGDGDVDMTDFGNLKSVLGLEGAALTAAMVGFDVDFNDDGVADLDDFAVLRANWGTTPAAPDITDLTTTPEPATMTVLALGGLLIVRRRRRKA